MELVRADADFGAHAEFAAVGEPRGGVPVDRGGIHRGQEIFRRGGILRDDAVAVSRSILVDVSCGSLGGRDQPAGNVEAEIFVVKLFFLAFGRGRIEFPPGGIAVDGDAFGLAEGPDSGDEFGGDLFIDDLFHALKLFFCECFSVREVKSGTLGILI